MCARILRWYNVHASIRDGKKGKCRPPLDNYIYTKCFSKHRKYLYSTILEMLISDACVNMFSCKGGSVHMPRSFVRSVSLSVEKTSFSSRLEALIHSWCKYSSSDVEVDPQAYLEVASTLKHADTLICVHAELLTTCRHTYQRVHRIIRYAGMRISKGKKFACSKARLWHVSGGARI